MDSSVSSSCHKMVQSSGSSLGTKARDRLLPCTAGLLWCCWLWGSRSRPSASPELEKGIHRLTCTSFSPAHTWAAEIIIIIAKGFALDLHPLHNKNMSKFGVGVFWFCSPPSLEEKDKGQPFRKSEGLSHRDNPTDPWQWELVEPTPQIVLGVSGSVLRDLSRAECPVNAVPCLY